MHAGIYVPTFVNIYVATSVIFQRHRTRSSSWTTTKLDMLQNIFTFDSVEAPAPAPLPLERCPCWLLRDKLRPLLNVRTFRERNEFSKSRNSQQGHLSTGITTGRPRWEIPWLSGNCFCLRCTCIFLACFCPSLWMFADMCWCMPACM